MADVKYNFLDNNFVTYENVETPKVTLNLPLMDEPLDISEWASGISSSGIPIVKNEEEKNDVPRLIVDNNNEQEIIKAEALDNPKPETTNSKPETAPNNSRFTSKNEWVNLLSNAYRKLGVSENGIRNLIAKNALESNWGKSALGKYNYGNITAGKYWRGSIVNGRDHNAKGDSIRLKFRSYNSIEDFARDELDFLKRLYDFNDSDNIQTFVKKLLGGNKGRRYYAESPTYGKNLINVYAKLK